MDKKIVTEGVCKNCGSVQRWMTQPVPNPKNRHPFLNIFWTPFDWAEAMVKSGRYPTWMEDCPNCKDYCVFELTAIHK